MIYGLNAELSIIGQMQFQTETEFNTLVAGVDYLLGPGHLRGALMLGLGDGAPDFGITASYLIAF